jgi:hypothetical protein
MVVAIVAMPVSADVSNSKIVPIDIVGNLHTSYEFQVGHVQFISRGMNLQDMNIWVQRTDNVTNLTPFDSRYNPDGSEIVGQNPDFLKVTLLPDGSDKWTDLAPGNFEAIIQKGDNDQPEYMYFTVVAHEYTTVTYLGDAKPTVVETQTIAPVTPVTTCIESADYKGTANELFDANRGQESVINAIQSYINDHPSTTQFTISASAGDLIINGDYVYVGDPSYGWVKTLTIRYGSSDGTHKTYNVIESDAGNYVGSNPHIYPKSVMLTVSTDDKCGCGDHHHESLS